MMIPRYAHYGPQDRYPPPPKAGMCISLFAVMKKENRVLAGIPRRHKFWFTKWIPQWKNYSEEELGKIFGKQTRLPSGRRASRESITANVARAAGGQKIWKNFFAGHVIHFS